MTEKKFLSDLISEDEIIKNPVTSIVAGLGSGKSTWVEGIHDSNTAIKGLVDRYKALYITSRRSKVDESHQNNPNLLKSIDYFFERKEALPQTESVACTFAHLVEFVKRSRETHAKFWRAFEYIIVDEFHSIATDATFTESSVVYDFLIEVYEDCIQGQSADDIKTRIVLLSATPNPIPSLLKKLNAHVLDFANETRWIKPNAINILPFDDVIEDIKFELELGGRVVYYSTFFDKYEELISMAQSVGLSHTQIIVDVSSEKVLKETREKYPLIYDNTENFRKGLSEEKSIEDGIRFVITNAKNKEGININSEIDLLVIENHYYTDIKQICGRFRSVVPAALIVDDSRQFDLSNRYYDEYRFACAVIESYNVYIQPYVERLRSNDQKIISDVDRLLKHSKYISFNWFKYCFELNECYMDCQSDFYSSISDYESRMHTECGWMDVANEDSYFKGISIFALRRKEFPQMSIEEEFNLCCNICEYTLGSVINYEELNVFSKTLNNLYKKNHNAKTFDSINCLLKKYGYRTKTIGKHTIKENRLYCIEKVS